MIKIGKPWNEMTAEEKTIRDLRKRLMKRAEVIKNLKKLNSSLEEEAARLKEIVTGSGKELR